MRNFRREAEKLGVRIYEVRKYKNKHGEGYIIKLAYIYSPTTVSTIKENRYHEMTLQNIIHQFEN